MTRFIYVRHGESVSTVSRVIGGHRTCSGLSALGIQQAERLRDRWFNHPEFAPDLVVSSHFPRARQTAEIVAQAFAGAQVVTDDGFGEHDPGADCDGMTMDDFVERYGTAAWEDDPFGVTFPGGESLAQFQFRVGTAVRRTTDTQQGQTILVVCHGGVIDAVMRHALKAPPTAAFMINTLNTSITELTLVRANMWSLRRFGDAAHLAGLPTATLS